MKIATLIDAADIFDVDYGTFESFLRCGFPDCLVGGIDFMDCFHHW